MQPRHAVSDPNEHAPATQRTCVGLLIAEPRGLIDKSPLLVFLSRMTLYLDHPGRTVSSRVAEG
eukprot:8687171-Alexandrium_andersonii.AAC.1